MDTFSPAVNMLLVNHGTSVMQFIDVISLRCCGFACHPEDMKNWLLPTVSFETEVSRLNDFLQMDGGLKGAEGVSDNRLFEMIEKGAVFGPIRKDVLQQDIQSSYFEGATKFMYCCRYEAGKYIVHDPDGFPMQLMTKSDILDLKTKSGFQVIWMEKGRGVRPDYYKAMTEAVSYKITHPCNFEQVPKPQGRVGKLAVQYGLQNYLLQTNQLIEFVKQFCGLECGRIYDELIRKACMCLNSCNLEGIRIFEEQLCKCLQEEKF